jgi:TonB family protein
MGAYLGVAGVVLTCLLFLISYLFPTKLTNEQAAQLIAILELRADRIRHELRPKYEFANAPEFIKRFTELHSMHIASLRAGDVLRAHEVLISIQQLSAELEMSEFEKRTQSMSKRGSIKLTKNINPRKSVRQPSVQKPRQRPVYQLPPLPSVSSTSVRQSIGPFERGPMISLYVTGVPKGEKYLPTKRTYYEDERTNADEIARLYATMSEGKAINLHALPEVLAQGTEGRVKLPGVASVLPGVSVDNPDFQFANYLDIIQKEIGSNWSPPQGAKKSGGRQKAVIGFRILRNGTIHNVRLETSSGVNLMDQSAMRAISRSSPLPPLPQRFRDEFLGVHFSFELEGERE